MIDVFLDERYIGKVENAQAFLDGIKKSRREGTISKSVGISYNDNLNEIHVETDKGRARRPLIVVEKGASKLTKELIDKLNKNELGWDDLVKKGVIEYLDSAEEENALVALDESEVTDKHNYLEISPVVILGLTTSLVPFGNYGQAPRVSIGSKSQKQALGFYSANYLLRMDTDVSILQYPQMPLVKTFAHDISRYDAHPAGQNVIVAVMSYEGYNMEDAIILNKGSIDRGLARSFYFRPYAVEELRYAGGLVDEIGLPDKEVKGYKSEEEYKFLEDDGIVYPEAELKEDDVIIGKTSPPRFLGEMEDFSLAANIRRESSVTVKHGETGIVDMIVLTENEEGNKLVQVRLRDQRVPEIGDKFASRHGQKGVIGMIVPQENMPFTASGIVPDIIFSPHSVPGRMTVSHLLECLAGKVGALSGRYIDSTAFSSEKEKDLREELLRMGFRENGQEKLYNGITGEEFSATIFIGSMYYLKLRHMVANKLHARASGRIQLLTRQPIEGRSKGGGLRLGEMEKDCFVAHGASLLLKERFDSDKAIVYICEECGMLAIHDEFNNKQFCPKCGNNVEITAIELSYAFKLLLDELKSLCLYPKLNLKSKY